MKTKIEIADYIRDYLIECPEGECKKCDGLRDCEMSLRSMIDVQYYPFQICPKCNGQGIVSKPPYIAGDINKWSSSAASFTCNLCNGAMVIPMYKSSEQ